MTDPQSSGPKGYGNIYTPHAGSMIIQVQREGGLANRTITLTTRQVRLLKYGWRIGATILTIGLATWIFLAIQAARVPLLTRQLTQMQTDLKRVDTLKSQLAEMERHFNQVQRMLSAGGSAGNRPAVQVATTETSPAPRRASRRAASSIAPDTASASPKTADSVRTTPSSPDTLATPAPTVTSP